MNHKPYGSYEKYFKRLLDIVCSLAAIIVFSWLYIILIILGAIFMRGNPFFTQERPGKDEKIFKLIKFRSMDNRKDKNGNLLPDEVRLNKYGQFLRKTSLDELPEAFNILKGDMSIIGLVHCWFRICLCTQRKKNNGMMFVQVFQDLLKLMEEIPSHGKKSFLGI